MTVRKIEVCVSNLKLGSQFVWTQASALHPDIRLRRWGCLGHCHRCLHKPFVLLNDAEFVEAQDAAQLWTTVAQRIEDEDKGAGQDKGGTQDRDKGGT